MRPPPGVEHLVFIVEIVSLGFGLGSDFCVPVVERAQVVPGPAGPFHFVGVVVVVIGYCQFCLVVTEARLRHSVSCYRSAQTQRDQQPQKA